MDIKSIISTEYMGNSHYISMDQIDERIDSLEADAMKRLADGPWISMTRGDTVRKTKGGKKRAD